MKEIALWGPSASGKTVLLSQLYLKARHGPERRWTVFPTPETQPFIDEMRTLMEDRREFPLGTREEEVRTISYEFVNSRTGERVTLFTEDKAGVHSELLTDSELERFAKADGLVMLVDAGARSTYESEVRFALERFYHAARSGGAEKDHRPVVFCLPKADELIRTPADLDRARDTPDEFVKEWFSQPFLKHIEDFCPVHRFFPVSSVGVRLRYGLIRPGFYFDEQLRRRLTGDAMPIHLNTPFEWLFDRIADSTL